MSVSGHTITVISPNPQQQDDTVITALLARHGIGVVARRDLPVPRTLAGQRLAYTLALESVRDSQALNADLADLADELQIDLVLQDLDSRLANYRLAVFDMDSTLIRCEVIDELAAHAGVGDAVADITERAMRGELDFDASFTERLAMLAGLSTSVLDSVAQQLPITEGLPELMITLRARGIRTAILSGGFDYFARHLQARFGFDEVHANVLATENGSATGKVVPPIVNGLRKRELLLSIAQEQGLSTRQVIAVGDGANDLPMLGCAGLGVAFHAKPIVRQQASYNLRYVGLDGVLYLLGSASERHG